MLSLELAKLRDTFEGWCRGDPYPTIESFTQFHRDLRELTKKLAAQEAGIDLGSLHVLFESMKPGSNVHSFSIERMRRRRDDGGAA
jgi:hypothetical protein